jgi:long-subunit fatty acid transport protein
MARNFSRKDAKNAKALKHKVDWFQPKISVNFILIIFFLISCKTAFSQSSGLSFLKLGVDGRATGMAEAFTAVVSDASATFWNPAGLNQAEKSHLTFTHNEWLEDVKSEFVAFVLPRENYSLGFSLNSTNISGIELRGNQPTVEPIATFDSHDIALGVSYARSLNNNFNYGVTVKYIYEKIYIEETGGLAADFGANYQFSSLPLRGAIVLQNIGFMSKLNDESPSLPSLVRAGIAYNPQEFFIKGSWLFAADVVSDFDSNVHVNFGTEYKFEKYLALRLGYQTGYDVKNLHFGFGLISGRFLLDYGFVPLKQDFGQGHRLSFGILF